ncbi:MFS transporter [Ferroacidibacillus organovorans]|uniref:MFS transporter n=2 Tax=Ferroacidibacillus organovorans TaxID=1765683 RepID=UPI0007A87DCD|nr:MFS transporter [Ferroacidibacillus organovorans]KYP81818.1 hypothetical protein AYJ22_05485 [Ferroacidibacillus organovorans]
MSTGYEEIVINERYSIINGSYAMFGLTIVGNFASLFVIDALHATSEEVALLTSLPALMTVLATWLGAVWLSRVNSKKMFCIRATSVARIFYLMIALAPFFIHGPFLAFFVVLLLAVMNFPQGLSQLSWQSLMGDLIPEDRRAAFFGIRNRITTIIAMIATLLPGLALQAFPSDAIPPYQVLFVLSTLFSFFEVYYLVYYLVLHRENTERRPDVVRIDFHVREMLKPFHHAPYRRFLIASMVFNFGWQLAWPLFSIYQIQYAHATAIWISAFNVASQITQILTFTLWGRISEKYGNTLALAFACLGMAATPVMTVVSRNLFYLTGLNLITGLFVSGINLLQFNHLLEVVPKQDRTALIAHFNVVIGVMGIVAPQIGVFLLGKIHMDPAMWVSTVLRLAGTLIFFYLIRSRIRETPGVTDDRV